MQEVRGSNPDAAPPKFGAPIPPYPPTRAQRCGKGAPPPKKKVPCGDGARRRPSTRDGGKKENCFLYILRVEVRSGVCAVSRRQTLGVYVEAVGALGKSVNLFLKGSMSSHFFLKKIEKIKKMFSHLPADDDASSWRRLVQEDRPVHAAVAGGHQVDAGKARDIFSNYRWENMFFFKKK